MKGTIVRTVIFIFALTNQFLTNRGFNPFPFSEEQLYVVLTDFFTLGAGIWVWWKNNSVTPEARKADEYLAKLKERT